MFEIFGMEKLDGFGDAGIGWGFFWGYVGEGLDLDWLREWGLLGGGRWGEVLGF